MATEHRHQTARAARLDASTASRAPNAPQHHERVQAPTAIKHASATRKLSPARIRTEKVKSPRAPGLLELVKLAQGVKPVVSSTAAAGQQAIPPSLCRG